MKQPRRSAVSPSMGSFKTRIGPLSVGHSPWWDMSDTPPGADTLLRGRLRAFPMIENMLVDKRTDQMLLMTGDTMTVRVAVAAWPN